MAATDRTWLWVLLGALVGLFMLFGGPWFLFGLPFMAFGLFGLLWMGAFLLPALLLALGILLVGYLAYRARVAKEEAPARELMADAGPDPVEEMSRVNDELEQVVQEASASLERTREAMERGLRG